MLTRWTVIAVTSKEVCFGAYLARLPEELSSTTTPGYGGYFSVWARLPTSYSSPPGSISAFTAVFYNIIAFYVNNFECGDVKPIEIRCKWVPVDASTRCFPSWRW